MANQQNNYRLQPQMSAEEEYDLYLRRMLQTPEDMKTTRGLFLGHLEKLAEHYPEVID